MCACGVKDLYFVKDKISNEKKEAAKIEEIIENSGILLFQSLQGFGWNFMISIHLVSGETRRGGEDKMLDDLERWVSKIYVSCIGENVAKINTIDMLHHIETRMEGLTQVLTNHRPRDLVSPNYRSWCR